jgi:tetratricopeptide (TPR) repeat protein
MFLTGRVRTDDGTPVPYDAMIERVCNNSVRQQVYATARGDFTMQMGSMADRYLDASGDSSSLHGEGTGKDPAQGISRHELANCELRARVSGFYSSVVSLAGLTTDFSSTIDVGAIKVHRLAKVEGMTVSAIPYKAPKDARKAYEKGLEAEKHHKLAEARMDFEKAVELYPSFANAWFHLGTVLQAEDQKDAARAAYTHATAIDSRFLPPYLSLAVLAVEAQDWLEVRSLTGHILDLDPLNHADANAYILDLDPLNSTEAYFYNALANYKLNRLADAEKSALRAEHVDLRTRFPQLHLLLAEIYIRKNNYAKAIEETQIYLELVPNAKDADQIREQLAKWEKLNGTVPISENVQN